MGPGRIPVSLMSIMIPFKLAFTATARDPKQLATFISELSSEDPIRRYWATQGCLILGKSAASAQEQLTKALNDKHSAIRVASAHALIRIGSEDKGKAAVVAELGRDNDEYSQLNLINSLTQLDLLAMISDEWVQQTLKNKKSGKYVVRLAQRIRDQRKGKQKK